MDSRSSSLEISVIQILGCPQDHSPLQHRGDILVCRDGHQFQFEQGIPVFTKTPRRELTPGNMAPCEHRGNTNSVDPFVNNWIVNTNGNLYRSSRGNLPRYPIPEWPLPSGNGATVVDVGCSWGRWSIAAARAGFRPVGIDVHVDALAAGVRVATQLSVGADFVCGDADHLPLLTQSVDAVFSYSVLQHLERSVVSRFFAEARRVLKPGGVCLVQLPNRFGMFSLLQQLRRGFREAREGTFEMRYWSHREISHMVRNAGLNSLRVRADGFLSQNPQTSDLDFLPARARWIVLLSEKGRRAADISPALAHVADSLWIHARARE
jgi:SAM-dependent methyltransferase